MYENRRRFVRVPLQTDVLCSTNSRQLQGVTWNLSQGGIQVDVGQLQAGEPVRVSFRLPVSATLIDAMGTVVWGTEKRQGIKFEHLNHKNERAIRDFIAEVEAQDTFAR
jgi:c-di-GMP-binding flagellar brake protein YcgR